MTTARVSAEPLITINGQRLTDGQAITIRAAIEALALSLEGDAPLGGDTHGREMTIMYRARLNEIRALIFQGSA
ncbi:hypothetical protein [Burkholderia multivorans]|uniref:hypothetical protein n=1 Tax=Burkholderia multivorans TaxID=87883 RepID=UPI0021BEAF41|nr:hypothetical protein [Burkholderia multivorans]